MNKSEIETIEVRIRLSLSRIMEIDIVGQSFTVEFQLEASWLDAAFAGRQQLSSDDEYDEQVIDRMSTIWTQPDGLRVIGSDKKYFSPMILFRNSIELSDLEEWGQIFPRESFGIVCYRVKTRGKFQQCMDLHSFPLDTQDLKIVLTSGHEANSLNPSINEPTDKRYAYKRVELVQNLSGKYRSFTNSRNFTFGNEYEMQEGVKFVPGITAKDESASLRQYPTLSMAAVVHRKIGYWVYNVVIPLYLITAVSCASFAVPPEDVADRCSITMTMMLTTVAYKYLISDRLPTISYLTLIDLYVLVNMLLQVLFIVLIVVQAGIADVDSVPANSQPNQIRFVILLIVIWSLFHIILAVAVWIHKTRSGSNHAMMGNKLWVRALKKEATMQTLYEDFHAARHFLTHSTNHHGHGARMSSSLKLMSKGVTFSMLDKLPHHELPTPGSGDAGCGLALSIHHWNWADAGECKVQCIVITVVFKQ
jgi:succinate dehydrogenase/fumarate reductase cytochrome b subunit